MFYTTYQKLTCSITDLEGNVLLSCADTFSLGLLQATGKLNRDVNSEVDRYEVHILSNKTDSIPPPDSLLQSNTSTLIVHRKQDLMRLFPDCFQGFSKFQDEPYCIDVDPGVPPKKTSLACRCLQTSRSANSRHHQASCSCQSVDQHFCHS